MTNTTQYPQNFNYVDFKFSTQDLRDDCARWLEQLRSTPMPNAIIPQSAYRDTQLTIQFPD